MKAYASTVTTLRRIKVHPFARGNKQGKLPPKYPYCSGGYNQKTEHQSAAEECNAMGYPKQSHSGMTFRREKKAWKKYEVNHSLKCLGSRERRIIRQWQSDECERIDQQMLRYAL